MTTDRLDAPVALIADDDEFMRQILSEAASAAGLAAKAVADGADALVEATKSPPDIFLLDVNMPGMDGFEACRALRRTEAFKLTPIVVITGNDDSNSVNEAYNCGATDFIAKPINASLLSHRLRYIMRGARNINELRKREERIHKLAYFDTLTGRPNREMLRETTAAYLSKLTKDRNSVALVHADLDGFQRYNDSFGYAAGDDLLVSVADRLSAAVSTVLPPRTQAMFARIGGDEFVVALCGPTADEAADALADQWAKCLQTPFMREETELFLSLSMGIASSVDSACDFESLMKEAGTALNAGKATGNGNTRKFHESMACETLDRVQLESRLRVALRNDKLDLHYQPKYCTVTGTIVGVEALLRWQDEQLGSVSPSKFIPLAEQTGLIMDINKWVVTHVCRQLRSWGRLGFEIPVAFNLSAAEFIHGDPVRLIATACESHDVSPLLLEVEITESTLMYDVEAACECLTQLRGMGVSISIDDFGTGYSSLAYLKRFNLDTLKIDRSFVEGITADGSENGICRAVIALARSLSLKVVAEGVETSEQNDWLVAESCDYVQGFLWSRPVPANEIQLLLLEASQGTQKWPRGIAAA